MKKMFLGILTTAMLLSSNVSVHAEDLMNIENNTMVISIEGEEHTLYLRETREESYYESMDLTYVGFDSEGTYSYEVVLRLPLGAEPGDYRCRDAGTVYKTGKAYDRRKSNCGMELYSEYSPLENEWTKSFGAYEYSDRYRGETYYGTIGDYYIRMTYRSDDWTHYQGAFVAELGTDDNSISIDSSYFDFTLGEVHKKTVEVDEMKSKMDDLKFGETASEDVEQEDVPMENIPDFEENIPETEDNISDMEDDVVFDKNKLLGFLEK